MNLEEELNRSWNTYSSGQPIYMRGGRLEVDEPQLETPTVDPMGMATGAGAPAAPVLDRPAKIDWNDPEQARKYGTNSIGPVGTTMREDGRDAMTNFLTGLGTDPYRARDLSERIFGTTNPLSQNGIGVLDAFGVPGAVMGIEEGVNKIDEGIVGMQAGREGAAVDLAVGIGLTVLNGLPLGAAGKEAAERIIREYATLPYRAPGLSIERATGAIPAPQATAQAMRRPTGEGSDATVTDMFARVGTFDEADGLGRISTRLPTGVKATEDPLTQDLRISVDAMKQDPKLYEKNVALVRDYPNMPAAAAGATTDEVTQQFKQQIVDNLLFLHDMVPEATRTRSKLWYDGARNIATRWSEKYGLPDTSVSGVLAALSPQKDWFQNVSLAERVLDIYTTKATHAWDDAMTATVEKAFPGDKYKPLRDLISGKTLSELQTPQEKAMWLRTYDEAYHDRGHRLVTPEGNFGDFVTTKSGANAGTGWGSMNEIGKAIQAIEAKGDLAVITRLMGERHKVRSFYNNIVAPRSRAGDVTIDTHAVAAGLLRPLSGNSLEVAHNFANSVVGMPNTGGSAITGVQGLYGLYADAYREAAAARGILPREMQSITWEAVRGLFPDTFKTAKNNARIDAIWDEFRNGAISIEDARSRIVEAAGGIAEPAWVGRDPLPAGAGGSSSYAGRVSEGGLFRGGSAGADGGTGSGAAGATAGLEPVPSVTAEKPGPSVVP